MESSHWRRSRLVVSQLPELRLSWYWIDEAFLSQYSLWNFEEKRCRFVEVKGPGDFLSETQKVGSGF